MEEILLKLNRVKTGIEQKIDSLATGAIANLDSAFASWRAPWTADRATKLDRLDVDVSSRADGASYTPARATKLDYLDVDVSSRSTQTSVDELMSNVGETADTGGTQTAGTVNAKLNAILQKQKVIRGLATFSGGSSTTNDATIELPQAIDPDYANVSVGYVVSNESATHTSIVVTNVTSTTIEIKYNRSSKYGAPGYTAFIEWQVVGGLV